MRRGGGRLRHERREEGGAVTVEAALLTPVIFLIIFGLFDAALLLRDYAGASSAARVGVRIASTGADSGACVSQPEDLSPCPANGAPELAQLAADQVATSASAVPKGSFQYILVYKANDAGFPGARTTRIPLAECLTECVAYRWSAAQERFRYAQGTWDSRTISACANPARGALDSVGVQIGIRHDFVAGALGSGMDVTDHAVMKFEPLANQFCASGEHP
jgi:hypothetical protein